jgi:propionate CoA-transferase
VKNKIVSPDEAAAIIRDGDTVSVSGFVGTGTPDELPAAIARRFQVSQRIVTAQVPGELRGRFASRTPRRSARRRR